MPVVCVRGSTLVGNVKRSMGDSGLVSKSGHLNEFISSTRSPVPPIGGNVSMSIAPGSWYGLEKSKDEKSSEVIDCLLESVGLDDH